MRFIVDAQLPRRLARRLPARGHDALHTLDLARGNRTPDLAIIELACRNDRIVVTKDADFVNSHSVRPLFHPGLIQSQGESHEMAVS